MKNYLSMLLIGFMFIGCTNQPKRVGTSQFPEIYIDNSKVEMFKDSLVSILGNKDYYIIESSKYKMDFRKDFAQGEDSMARALMQSVDGSTIDSKGIVIFFMPKAKTTLVKSKPYLYKTFSYGRKNPQKHYVDNNNRWYNSTQTILDTAYSSILQ